MRTIVALVSALAFTNVCTAQEFDPSQGEEPLAVFLQSDPWSMVIGSDTPRVAIYENGDVIFIKKINDQLTYHKINLDARELEGVRIRLQPVLSLKDLKSSYNLRPTWTDQPTAEIYIRSGAKKITTSVYGMTCSSTPLPPDTDSPSGSAPDYPPKEILKIHQWLCDLDFPRSKSWAPKYIEVMLWDYAYAPDPSIHWPNAWPTLNSDRAIRRKNMYSIFLDGSMLSELQSFLSTRNSKGAVEISEKKMAASYRFVFPGEPVWRNSFRAAAKLSKPE